MSDAPADRDGSSPGTGAGSSGDPRTAGADERPDRAPDVVDPDRTGRAPADEASLRWLTGVVSLVGLWLAGSAFLYDATAAARWNNLVVGGAICLLGGYGFARLLRDQRPDLGSTGLAALLGLWAVAAPFLLDFGSEALVWSTTASGIAVAVLSGYGAYESRRTETARTAGSRA